MLIHGVLKNSIATEKTTHTHFRLRSSLSSLSSSPGAARKGAASFATRSSANSGYLF